MPSHSLLKTDLGGDHGRQSWSSPQFLHSSQKPTVGHHRRGLRHHRRGHHRRHRRAATTATAAARGPAEAAAAPATATAAGRETTAAGTGGRTGPLEVLGAHAHPAAGRRSPDSMTRCRSWAGRPPSGVAAAGRGRAAALGPAAPAGRRPRAGPPVDSRSGSGPLAALALLEVALVVSSIDIAVAVSQDIVLPSRRPHFGLRQAWRPGPAWFRLWVWRPGRAVPAGRWDVLQPLARTAGTDSASRPGARLAGAGGQPVLVARPVIEVPPFGGQGRRPSGTFANAGPFSGRVSRSPPAAAPACCRSHYYGCC